jgi:hypothetical protein
MLVEPEKSGSVCIAGLIVVVVVVVVVQQDGWKA